MDVRMKCKLCQRMNVKCTCLCGFCDECIRNYGHDNCRKMLEYPGEKKSV